jgi:hypothetical protein
LIVVISYGKEWRERTQTLEQKNTKMLCQPLRDGGRNPLLLTEKDREIEVKEEG